MLLNIDASYIGMGHMLNSIQLIANMKWFLIHNINDRERLTAEYTIRASSLWLEHVCQQNCELHVMLTFTTPQAILVSSPGHTGGGGGGGVAWGQG